METQLVILLLLNHRLLMNAPHTHTHNSLTKLLTALCNLTPPLL